jgi:hypothetical protein
VNLRLTCSYVSQRQLRSRMSQASQLIKTVMKVSGRAESATVRGPPFSFIEWDCPLTSGIVLAYVTFSQPKSISC